MLTAVVLSILLSRAGAAPSAADLDRVAASKAWLRLMHYLPSGRGHKSELDGPGFFFAPDGKTNPRAELEAAVNGFETAREIGRLKLHPQCAFPERFRFIREAFPGDYRRVECPLLDEFHKNFKSPTGISVVFSSAYPNNPASSFGHTFLKVESERKNHLLDMGINFAAHTPRGVNMIEFMYLGVFGGYPGLWSLEPYFQKVNEYVNSESRDLWEYELSLSKDETIRLLNHIWELEVTTYFDYYFFDENCSYQILRAIEAIKLDWDLAHHRIYVIPGETIKRLTDVPGAIRDVRFRPSLFHQVEWRQMVLDRAARRAARRVARSVSAEIEDRHKTPEVLDAALAMLMFEKAEKKRKWSDADQARENRVLAMRAQIPGKASEAPFPRGWLRTRPDYGHDPYSAGLALGNLSRRAADGTRVDGPFGRLRLRSAYHNLMAPDAGFAPFSEIEFPWIEFQFHEENFRLNALGLVESTSLFPLTAVDRRLSWRIKWGMNTDRGTDCDACLVHGFEGGVGGALGGLSERFYVLALGRAEAASRLPRGHRLRPGVEAGSIITLGDRFKTGVSGRLFWSTADRSSQERAYELSIDQSVSLRRNSELRLRYGLAHTEEWTRSLWQELSVQWIEYFR